MKYPQPPKELTLAHLNAMAEVIAYCQAKKRKQLAERKARHKQATALKLFNDAA